MIFRILIPLLLVSFGCAGIDANPVVWDDWTGKATTGSGFRYYMPEPYLQVSGVTLPPVRIDFDPKLKLTLRSNEKDLELGKLVGLDPKEKIRLELSDNKFVQFVNPDDPKKPLVANVSARATDKVVEIKVQKNASASTQPKNAKFTITASYNGMDLGKGTYSVSEAQNNYYVSAAIKSVKPGYKFSIVYLPNPTRIIAVEHVDGIGGSAELKMKLKDGWMLTEVGTVSDTQSDENITAVANLVKEVGGLASGLVALGGAAGGAATRPKDLTGLYRPVFENGIITKFIKVELLGP